MHNLNMEIFNLINGYANQNQLLSVTAIIMAKYMIIIVPIYLVWMFLRKDNYFKQQSLFTFYAGIVGLLLNFIITIFYFHPRPFMSHEGRLLISHAPDSSFPSDHTTLLLSMGFYLLFESKLRLYGILLSIAGFIVGLARIYCGVHWPYDIAGSIVVSFFASLLIICIKNSLYKPNQYIILMSEKLMKKAKEYVLNITKIKISIFLILFFSFCASLAVSYYFYMEEYGNFHIVTKDVLYRSGQMDKDEFVYYTEKYHIKSVINLRGKQSNKSWYKEEVKLSKEMGIVHYDFRIPSDRVVAAKKLVRLIGLLEKLPKPILVHCKAGADRSGLISAVWEYSVEKEKPSKASEQLSLLYFHFPYLGSPSEAMDKSFWLFVKRYPRILKNKLKIR